MSKSTVSLKKDSKMEGKLKKGMKTIQSKPVTSVPKNKRDSLKEKRTLLKPFPIRLPFTLTKNNKISLFLIQSLFNARLFLKLPVEKLHNHKR